MSETEEELTFQRFHLPTATYSWDKLFQALHEACRSWDCKGDVDFIQLSSDTIKCQELLDKDKKERMAASTEWILNVPTGKR